MQTMIVVRFGMSLFSKLFCNIIRGGLAEKPFWIISAVDLGLTREVLRFYRTKGELDT